MDPQPKEVPLHIDKIVTQIVLMDADASSPAANRIEDADASSPAGDPAQVWKRYMALAV